MTEQLIDWDDEERGEWMEIAAAIFPIITAEVQAAKAEAWDDGESSGLTEAGGGYGWPNPYRATETGDRA